jgi:hypothetical protein
MAEGEAHGTHNTVVLYPEAVVRLSKEPVLAQFTRVDAGRIRGLLPSTVKWSTPNKDGKVCIGIPRDTMLVEALEFMSVWRSYPNEARRVEKVAGDLNNKLLEIANTIAIWALCSQEKVSPRLIKIALVTDGEGPVHGIVGEVPYVYRPLRLLLVNERFQTDLAEFYKTGPGAYLRMTLGRISPTELKIRDQVAGLIRRLVYQLSIACTDLKPLNTVLNLGMPGKRERGETGDEYGARVYDIPGIEARFIDNDSDFCTMNKILMEKDEASASARLGMEGWSQDTVKECNYWLGLVLMANHMFMFQKRNIFYGLFHTSALELVGDLPRTATLLESFNHLMRLVRADGTGEEPLFRKLFMYYCRLVMLNRIQGVEENYQHMGDHYFCSQESRLTIQPTAPGGLPIAPDLVSKCLCLFAHMMMRCFQFVPPSRIGGTSRRKTTRGKRRGKSTRGKRTARGKATARRKATRGKRRTARRT